MKRERPAYFFDFGGLKKISVKRRRIEDEVLVDEGAHVVENENNKEVVIVDKVVAVDEAEAVAVEGALADDEVVGVDGVVVEHNVVVFHNFDKTVVDGVVYLDREEAQWLTKNYHEEVVIRDRYADGQPTYSMTIERRRSSRPPTLRLLLGGEWSAYVDQQGLNDGDQVFFRVTSNGITVERP